MRIVRLASSLIGTALVLSLASSDGHADGGPIVVHRGDVEGLYAAVNNPANAHKTVVLDAGTYVLTAIGPKGARPRGGALLLQEGMQLVGHNQYADRDRDGVWDADQFSDPVVAGETVIDGHGIVPFADVGPDGQPALDCTGQASDDGTDMIIVAMRDGSVVAQISVLSGDGQLGIGTPNSIYLPTRGYSLEVRDSYFHIDDQSVPNAGFTNNGCRMRDAHSQVFFERNIVVGGAEGVALINVNLNEPNDSGARGPTLSAVVSSNHILFNYLGLHSRNTTGTDGGHIVILSTGNLFEGNFYGLEATAGTDLGFPTGANGNTYDLESYGDVFRDNDVDILADGAWPINPDATGNSNNTLRVSIDQDQFEDLDALHVWSTIGPRAGVDVNNHVQISVRDSMLAGEVISRFLFLDSDASDSNSIDLLGSDADFRRTNGVKPTYATQVPPNPIDLAHRALHFTPVSGGAYRMTADNQALLPFGGTALAFGTEDAIGVIGDFDDDTLEVPLPFTFNYAGHGSPPCQQSSGRSCVWVNVDGNLTFGTPDFASTPRDVPRLISGAPRIAPLLDDLFLFADPDLGLDPAIYANVSADGKSFIFTWDAVPGWDTFVPNTFQIVLHKSGVIDFIYDDLGTVAAVAGLAPGHDHDAPAGSDLSAGGASGAIIFENFFADFGP